MLPECGDYTKKWGGRQGKTEDGINPEDRRQRAEGQRTEDGIQKSPYIPL